MASTIEEIGVVRDIVEGMVVVGIEQSSRCQTCGMCANADGRERRLTAFSDERFQIGERVKVHIEGKNLMAAAFILYMMPLLDMFIGYFAGYFITIKLGYPDNASLVAGLSGAGCFIISFVFGRIISKQWESSKKPLVTLQRI